MIQLIVMKTHYQDTPPKMPDPMIWHICYFLQVLGYFTLVTWIFAFFIALLKRRDVQHDLLLYSHAIWQLRTIVYAFVWLLVSGAFFWVGLITLFLGIGFIFVAIGVGIATINFCWVIYRIAYGWFKLYEVQVMPVRFSLAGSYFYG